MNMTFLELGFLQSLGIATLVAISFDAALRHFASELLRKTAATIAFSAGLLLSMSAPSEIQPGVYFDLRHVFLVLAASYGGWVAGLAVAVAASAFRIHIGGMGVESGLIGIWISATVGFLFAYFGGGRNPGWRRLTGLGVGASASVASLMVLPTPLALDLFKNHTIPMAAANLAGVILTGLMIRRELDGVKREEELSVAASIDGLTGIRNRRGFQLEGPRLAERAYHQARSCSLLLLDVDHFKGINDTFGHPTGDEVLHKIARIVASHARGDDLVARYGGEEFVVLLNGATGATARATAERIRTAIERTSFTCRGLPFRVTISIGIAEVTPGADGIWRAVGEADSALYQAKNLGRNRTETALAA